MRLIVTPIHLICGKEQNEKLQVIFSKFCEKVFQFKIFSMRIKEEKIKTVLL